ncbi:MAG: hypothetical protein ACI4WX_16465 [Aristaeellaceae bacterium]
MRRTSSDTSKSIMTTQPRKFDQASAAKWICEGGLFVIVSNLVTVIVNCINCIWVAVAGQWVASWLYNIGTTVLNGGVSMVVFFFVNKIIFPEGEAKPEAENA